MTDPTDLYQLHKDKSFRTASITVTDDDEDMVFMAQPTTTTTTTMASTRGAIHEVDAMGEMIVPKGRFVAGETFFNYAAFGSLREGLPTVRLLSPQYMGLAFNAIVSGFALTFASCALRPLLVAMLTKSAPDEIIAGSKLVKWPGTLAVAIGLISDCYPLCGYRRKSYMMLGWILMAAMYFTMSVIEMAVDKTHPSIGYMYLVSNMMASVGHQIMWITSLAMTVEFAQREHLYERGHLQSLFFILRFGAAAATHVLCAYVIRPQDDGSLQSDISLCGASFLLGVVCLLPLPMLYWFLLEDYAPSNHVSLTGRLRELWNFLQQKVVYCIFFYLVGTVFLLSAASPDVQNAVFAWAGYTPAKLQWLLLSVNAPKLLGVIIFKYAFLNVDWRKLGACGLCLFVACTVALAIPVAHGEIRHMWYLYLMMALSQIPQGFYELFTVIPATEIADVGREGVTMGLISSFMVLISIAASTLWDSVNSAVGIKIDMKHVAMDLSSARHDVTVATIAYSVVQLFAVAMFWFLPKQKLDAQQLRAFGGYNRVARLVIVSVFLALFVYDLTSNLLTV